jgi:hypothetical protein
MAHAAEVDSNNTVVRVLVVPDEQEHRIQDYLANELGLGGTWVQTSYNNALGSTMRVSGIHTMQDAMRSLHLSQSATTL